MYTEYTVAKRMFISYRLKKIRRTLPAIPPLLVLRQKPNLKMPCYDKMKPVVLETRRHDET